METTDIPEEDFSPIHSYEWSFDDVPDEEIIACCLWEYAKESKTIQTAAGLDFCTHRHLEFQNVYGKDPGLKQRHDEIADSLSRQLQNCGVGADAMMDRLLETGFFGIGIFDFLSRKVHSMASHWQCQPENYRKYVCGKLGESMIFRPLKTAWVGDLENLWDANKPDLMEARAVPFDPSSDAVDCCLYTEVEPVMLPAEHEMTAEEMVQAFVVDFSRFTDSEITAEFTEWLRLHRPPEWQAPRRIFPNSKQKGRKLVDYRAALDRLGLMRLLHWYSPEELQGKQLDAWRKFGRKASSFRREVRAAGDFLTKLFPFLPATERPESEKRLAVWLQETMEELDEMEAAMGWEWGPEGGTLNPP